MILDIIEASINDIILIHQIEVQCFDNPWSLQMFESSFKSDDKIFISKLNSEITGYCLIKIFEPESEIIKIAVKPDHQKCGIGRQLLNFILTYSKNSRCSLVFLEVNDNNKSAFCLYTSCGFEITGKRDNYYTNGNALLMQRNI